MADFEIGNRGGRGPLPCVLAPILLALLDIPSMGANVSQGGRICKAIRPSSPLHRDVRSQGKRDRDGR